MKNAIEVPPRTAPVIASNEAQPWGPATSASKCYTPGTMKLTLSTLTYVAGLSLTAISGLMYANEYQAMSDFVGNDCDGLIRILLFLIPGTLCLGFGTFLLWKHSPWSARHRTLLAVLTFAFWTSVVVAKARDLHLHYACQQ